MDNVKNLIWFKNNLESKLLSFELQHKYFEEGDFGTLNQIEFNSLKIGGNIDFWSLGWIGIFIWDYQKEKELFNVLLNPEQTIEIDNAFIQLEKLLL